ncbi:MAG: hypothetical protein NT145_03255 [Elusimicrobia bacterium]|nr:hypothetical protein [Elusimicrobiota bacterium]
MKKVLFALSMMLVFISYAVAAQSRIAVMKLEDKTGHHEYGYDIGEGVADMMVTEFTNTKKVRVVERAELETVMKEQNIGLSGAVNAQTAAQLGKILGVQYMVIGSVNEFGTKSSNLGAFGVGVKSHSANVGLDIRIIDTTNAEVIAAATGQGKKSTKAVDISNADILPTNVSMGSPEFSSSLVGKATREAVQDAVSKVIDKIGGSWQGAVAAIAEDGTITINGGENVGIAAGDIFKVVRKGEEITDPETGESLGSEDKTIGEIKIVEVKPKYSKAKAVSGTGIQKSDKVEKK